MHISVNNFESHGKRGPVKLFILESYLNWTKVSRSGSKKNFFNSKTFTGV